MHWILDDAHINWHDLSNLYRIAPLGDKSPENLKLAFSNSRFKCFVFEGEQLIGAGRVLSDGVDCAYICDIAVHPDFQGTGLGKQVTQRLMDFAAGHKKMILYAVPGKEGFYHKLGFRMMNTAMAIFESQALALEGKRIRETIE
jgi:ribosomal protein S18 acetylase RimI-like enzyme